GTVILWDVATRQLRHHLQGLKGKVNDLEFSADRRWLIGGSAGGTVMIWNVANGNIEIPLDKGLGNVVTVAISAEGNTLAYGCAEGGHGFLSFDWPSKTVKKSGWRPAAQEEMYC